MFEKVAGGRTGRPRWMQPRAVAASAAAHAVVAAGIAALPPASVVQARSVEATTLLVITQAERSPALPARTLPGRESAPAAAPRAPAAARDGPGSPAPPLVPPAAVPGALPSIAPVPAPPADPAADLRSLALVASDAFSAEGGAPSAAALLHGGGGDGGPAIVAADMLAELPRMVNQREITRLLGRLYPRRLRVRGVEGEVSLRFVIGLDGRVEPRTVEVIAASHPALVEPTLRALEVVRFRPARLHGQAVRVQAALPVLWVLRPQE